MYKNRTDLNIRAVTVIPYLCSPELKVRLYNYVYKGTRLCGNHTVPQKYASILLLVLSQSWPELDSSSFGACCSQACHISPGRVNFVSSCVI
jgi:hypothetical protein